MEQLHRAADKLEQEYDILSEMADTDGPPNATEVELLLSQAKRVRNASTVLVRELAQKRDELQNQEVHKLP